MCVFFVCLFSPKISFSHLVLDLEHQVGDEPVDVGLQVLDDSLGELLGADEDGILLLQSGGHLLKRPRKPRLREDPFQRRDPRGGPVEGHVDEEGGDIAARPGGGRRLDDGVAGEEVERLDGAAGEEVELLDGLFGGLVGGVEDVFVGLRVEAEAVPERG